MRSTWLSKPPEAHSAVSTTRRWRPCTPRCRRNRCLAWSRSGRSPPSSPRRRPTPEGWDAPFDTQLGDQPQGGAGAPHRQMHRRLDRARHQGRRRGAAGTPSRPATFYILVRQRGPLFEAVIRALKNAGIAVAGADRLILTEHVAVMDLLALADALLLPDDDLALATVLKSPLFGLDEEGAVRPRVPAAAARCATRCGPRRRRARRSRPPRSGSTGWRAADARRLTPFGFFADLLGAAGGRRKTCAGSGRRPPTHSMSSSTSRSTTSAPKRHRCKASSLGCARPRSR